MKDYNKEQLEAMMRMEASARALMLLGKVIRGANLVELLREEEKIFKEAQTDFRVSGALDICAEQAMKSIHEERAL